MNEITEVEPGGTVRYDEMGRPITDMATCGHCGRTWDDAIITSRTPAPAGRCPFEDEHVYEDEADDEHSDAWHLGHHHGATLDPDTHLAASDAGWPPGISPGFVDAYDAGFHAGWNEANDEEGDAGDDA